MMKIQARIKKKIKIFHKPTKQRSIILTFYDISLQIFFLYVHMHLLGLRRWHSSVFLPGESQGRRSLVGCRLWGRTESDTTEATQQQQQRVVLVVKNPPASAGRCNRHGFDAWVRKIPWRRKWQPTPVFLPGESHGLTAWQATVRGVPRVGHDLATKPPQLKSYNICIY